MNFRRALSVTRRIFRGLRHDKRTVAMMSVTPIVAMVVFGLAFSGDVKDLHVAIVNLDEGAQTSLSSVPISIANDIIADFNTGVLKVDQVGSVEEGIERVRAGKAYGLIVFPSNFTSGIYAKIQDPSLPRNTIMVELDKSNVNIANAITKAVSDALSETMNQVGFDAPVVLDTGTAIYAENAKFLDVFLPGIMAFVVFILTFILTLVSFVGERTSGSLERLEVTPLRESEIVIGYAVAFSIIAMLQSVILLAVSFAVFNIMIVGSVFLAFLVMALLAILSLSLGILLSSLAKREAQAIQFLPIVALPVFLLSGIFWPVEAIPSWLRPLSYAIPPTYAVDALRSVLLRGWDIGRIWIDLVAMFGFAAAFLGLSVWSLHRARR